MRFYFLVICYHLLILVSLQSQEEWWHLTTDDGLDSDRILNVYQADNGDIWIGTDKGITRYNGVFEQRSLLEIEESSLLGEDSNSILELPSGQILARGVGRLGKVKINLFDGKEWSQAGFLHDNDIWVSLWPEFAVNSNDGLWISTWSDGLARFDGDKWQLYDLDIASLKLSDQDIASDLDKLSKIPKDFDQLIESVNCACGHCSRLTIYACGCKVAKETENSFAEQFDQGKTVEQIRSEYLLENGSQYSTYGKANWLVQTPDGKFWTESSNTGEQTIITSFDGQKWIAEFNTNNSILDITQTVFATSTGKILIGTSKGLFQYDPVVKTITDLQLGQVSIRQIHENSEGTLWVGTDKGLFKSDISMSSWQQQLDNLVINTIGQNKQGITRIGTSNGLYRYQNRKWILELSGVVVNCFTELTDGTFLVGSNGGLRIRYPADKSITMGSTLPVTLIGGLFQASDGKIWCRSMAGIFSYDGLEWTNHGQKKPDSAAYAHLFYLYTNIYEDKHGTIWFSDDNGLLSYKENVLDFHSLDSWTSGFADTESGDVWVMGQKGPHVYDGKDWSILPGFNDQNDYSSNYAAYQNDDGTVWVVGDGSSGVWLYDNGKWVKGLDSDSEPMEGGKSSPLKTSDGTLWISSTDGIYYLNSDQRWEKSIGFKYASSASNGGNYSPQLHLTSNGTLIAVNAKEGLLTYDGNDWSKHPSYGPGRQYNDHLGHGFLEYPEGVYWLATNKGVRRIQGSSWYDLTVSDGLPSNDVYTIERDKTGNIWIGTTQGLAQFRPNRNLNSPGVEITKIDGLDIPDDRIYITGHSFVTLDWRGGDIETSPSRLQFQYGINGQWSEPLKQRTATVGLQNGEHKLYIRAIDHHFNTSSVDSMTVIVKTDAPYLSIGSPATGDVISGQFYIKGRIEDDDFAAFQLFISDTDLTSIPTLLDDLTLQLPYSLIFQAESAPKTETLSPWNTTIYEDGDYQIWLTAQDELGHSSDFRVMVRTDNTRPSVKILTPVEGQSVLKEIDISAMASDYHLSSYRLDYTTNIASNEWWQVYVKSNIYQKDESGLLKPIELIEFEIKQNWKVPPIEGSVWVRLTAADFAGNTNSQTVQVKIPPTLEKRQGGVISSVEQKARLYVPPNALPQDTIITVNELTQIEVEPPLPRISQIYQLDPILLTLNPIKPVTLILSYDSAKLSTKKEPVIFHRKDGPWEIVGGTPNPEKQTITAPVSSLGQYVVVETDQSQDLDGTVQLVSESVTCQPRVFSPKGNSFHIDTTISFMLDQPANVSIKVYSVGGQLVNWLIDQRIFNRGKQAVTWNGRDDNGQIVPTGLYIVTVAVGSETQSKVVNIWNH